MITIDAAASRNHAHALLARARSPLESVLQRISAPVAGLSRLVRGMNSRTDG